jgi:Arc/MetJ family transcription regulator
VARVRITVDDELVARVCVLYGLRSDSEAVDVALRRLLVEPTTVAQALELQGGGWGGDLDEMRSRTSPRT